MMVPNLIGVLAMMPVVIKLTKNYVDRRIKHKDVEPMLSFDPAIQADHAKDVELEEKEELEALQHVNSQTKNFPRSSGGIFGCRGFIFINILTFRVKYGIL